MEALSRLSADEEVSRSLYRMGFRSLDEVVEASEAELASVPGVSSDDVAASSKRCWPGRWRRYARNAWQRWPP